MVVHVSQEFFSHPKIAYVWYVEAVNQLDPLGLEESVIEGVVKLECLIQ